MTVIFYFSSRTSTESAAQSNGILQWIKDIFGDNGITDIIVRKSAHCLEYTGLCLLLNFAWIFTRGKRSMTISVICASLYAASDEIHQIFVDGRSCELRDWAIDTAGAILGAIGFFVIYIITEAIIKKRKSALTTK